MQLQVTFGQWDSYLLLLMRIGAMVGIAPVLGSRPIPMQVKVGLSALIAWVLLPLVQQAPAITSELAMLIAVAKEVLVGLLLGFSAALIFSAVHVATRFMGQQVGLGMPSMVDPLWPENEGFLDTLYALLATVIFLNLGGHHALLAALANSLEVVPLGQFAPASILGDRLVTLSAVAISTGAALAMPIVGTMLVADTGMALVVRTFPQANIFSVGMPTKMALGAFMLVTLMPATVGGLSSLIQMIGQASAGILR